MRTLEIVHEFPVGPDRVVIPDDVDEKDVTIEELANGTRVTIEVEVSDEFDLEADGRND